MGALSSDNLGGGHVSNLITLVMLGVEPVSFNRSEKTNRQARCASASILRLRLTKRRLMNRAHLTYHNEHFRYPTKDRNMLLDEGDTGFGSIFFAWLRIL